MRYAHAIVKQCIICFERTSKRVSIVEKSNYYRANMTNDGGGSGDSDSGYLK